VRQEHIARFVGIPEHIVRNIHFLDKTDQSTTDDTSVERVVIELGRVARHFRCPCGRRFDRYYDCRDQFVRDLPWGPWSRVELLVPRFRVACPDCGVRTERLDWLGHGRRHTKRLADAVALACREVRSIKAIAEAFHLDWHTVKRIDKAALDAEINPPDLSGLKHLAIDEFSIKRRHTYGTIFLDVQRNRVVRVCATREKQAVVDVFERVFGREVCAGIEAVSMDWWPAYDEAVAQCLPNAEVVWDFFHIVKKYNLEVIDRVRLDEARRCQTRMERRSLKKTKFILLKNRRNLLADELGRLKDLLRVNRRLATVYILRDALPRLWEYRYPACALRWFHSWYARAIRSRIEPLKRFARAIKDRLDGVLAHCRYPIHTGTLEGVNNKVKVIKRIAYGFRDQDYFFLKIRAHFPGVTPL